MNCSSSACESSVVLVFRHGLVGQRAWPPSNAALPMGKHVANSLFGCFVSACCCSAFIWVLGKHCMHTVHFRSMAAWRLTWPLLPPPLMASLAALAWFFARADMAVLFALPPPIA